MHLSLHSVTPIFTLSSVSGESLDLLKVFLNILPPLTNSKEQEELMQQLTEFQVLGDRQEAAGVEGGGPGLSLGTLRAHKPGGRTLTVFFGSRWMKSTQSRRWGLWLEEHYPGDCLVTTLLSPHLLLETSCMKEPLGLNRADLQDVLVCRLAFALRAGGSSVLLACGGGRVGGWGWRNGYCCFRGVSRPLEHMDHGL